jgi:hypothetical protein
MITLTPPTRPGASAASCPGDCPSGVNRKNAKQQGHPTGLVKHLGDPAPFPTLSPAARQERSPAAVPKEESIKMAKTNYAFEKRQRDLLKKQKKEEKQKRKTEDRGSQPEESEAGVTETDPAQNPG